MGRPYDAVVAGHLCIDVFPSFPSLKPDDKDNLRKVLVPGKLVETGPLTVSTGGPVSNTGIALLVLGIKTELMGKVGTDEFGGLIGNILEQRDAGRNLIVVDGETTSYTIAIAVPGSDRIFLHHPGSNNTYCAADVNYEIAAQSRLFHFGYPPLMKRMFDDGGTELSSILSRVHSLGTITSLDMSLPDPDSPSGKVDWLGILSRSLPHVDIFLPSAEETMFMLDRPRFDELQQQGNILDMIDADDLSRLSRRALELGCKVAVIKCGHRGVYVRTGDCTGIVDDPAAWSNRELWEPVYKVDRVVSATGSGDSAIAGFLAAFLRNLGVEECARYATAVGAENVEAMDAISGVGTWDEITARIRAGWPKVPLTVTAQGWKLDDARQTWIGPCK